MEGHYPPNSQWHALQHLRISENSIRTVKSAKRVKTFTSKKISDDCWYRHEKKFHWTPLHDCIDIKLRETIVSFYNNMVDYFNNHQSRSRKKDNEEGFNMTEPLIWKTCLHYQVIFCHPILIMLAFET